MDEEKKTEDKFLDNINLMLKVSIILFLVTIIGYQINILFSDKNNIIPSKVRPTHVLYDPNEVFVFRDIKNESKRIFIGLRKESRLIIPNGVYTLDVMPLYSESDQYCKSKVYLLDNPKRGLDNRLYDGIIGSNVLQLRWTLRSGEYYLITEDYSSKCNYLLTFRKVN